ncbi:AcvB/VirJ family lysyl-phosphatidylglycerol hydrolase [Pedobacter gandavensis]|uniref:AcvB/VirJ family lysyl-phosphatidylglycerol hydrolase n=1 Tax=Pedobacter gandavensis TaxID=2679963 RepID=UPI00292D3DD3|nr:AcvB/VirJ family lysyl-phosphatidylglycerol hydrolase [Pedobacter gandavensis]
MDHSKAVVLLAFLLLLSGCGLFLRDRKIRHAGIEKDDYDLPVILYPSVMPESRKLIFLLSGDGGWLEFEDGLAQQFSKQGFQTVGFNTRNYFWEQRTPEELSQHLLLLLRTYRRMYNANEIYLCGYSFGADIIPFAYNRLPFGAKRRISGIQLCSPFATSDFKVRTVDLLNIGGDDKPYKVIPEVRKINIPILCYYGIDENPKALKDLQLKNFKLILVPGDHSYEAAAIETIVSGIPVKTH